MSSDEELSSINSEDYISDDTESIDFQEIEIEERVNLESEETMPQQTETSDDEDYDYLAYSEEPLADAEWLKSYKEQQEEKKKQEEELKNRLVGDRRTGEW